MGGLYRRRWGDRCRSACGCLRRSSGRCGCRGVPWAVPASPALCLVRGGMVLEEGIGLLSLGLGIPVIQDVSIDPCEL